jgi:hypothetical protein
MINFKFNLEIPWWNRFDSIKSWAGKTPFKNKFWEVQVMKSNDIVAVDLSITARTDHAGADLWLALLGYSVNFKFYDNRHWDYEKNIWQAADKN